MHSATGVVLIHGSARQLLFPIYGWDQAIFVAAILLATIAIFALIDVSAIPYVLGGAWLGIWITQARHAPVRAHVPAAKLPQLISILREANWKPEPDEGHWVPNVAKWRHWRFVEIRLQPEGDLIRITGPGENVVPLITRAAD